MPDIITALIALGSLGVSIWAVCIAKTEPARARTRADRDLLRETLISALQAMTRLSRILAAGDPVPSTSPEIPAAREVVNNYWRRLPEAETVNAMIPKLYLLQATWDNAAWAEEKVRGRNADIQADEVRLEKSPADATFIRPRIRENRASLEEDKRYRDGVETELRKAVDGAQSFIQSYIDELDDKDRAGKS